MSAAPDDSRPSQKHHALLGVPVHAAFGPRAAAAVTAVTAATAVTAVRASPADEIFADE
ncbi:hypothetical protein GCM10010230_33260 [Streptomyces narbonensis]|nr:hypothetical protein GCM10010230_33260 [Streptomyces narbonensis]